MLSGTRDNWSVCQRSRSSGGGSVCVGGGGSDSVKRIIYKCAHS